MEIKVNNQTECVADGVTVATIVGEKTAGVAVAVNGKIIRKNEWNALVLKEGDDVVVIRAAYGG